MFSALLDRRQQESGITDASRLLIPAGLLLVAGLTANAHAQSDPYRITASEKAACTADAIRLCSDAYPDEHKLLSCMSANRSMLTRVCGMVFDAGVKRRRLVSR